MSKLIIPILLFVMLIQACKDGEDIIPPETGGGAALYFSGEVNGQQITMEAGKNGYAQGHTWGAIGVPPLPVWGCHFTTINSFDDGISFFMINQSQMVDTNRQKDLEKTLTTGNKSYTKATDIKENEVFISYRRNAFSYETALINQGSNTLSIESVKDTVFDDRQYVITTIKFDALLYSQFNQDTIEIKNGRTRVAYLATR